MLATRTSKSRQGTAAVEFALIAPVFFMLLLGIIEFGRMIMVEQVITNAAREGARIAIVPGTSTATTQSQVASYLVNGAIIRSTSSLNAGGSNPSFSVSPDPPSSAASGTLVTVTVSVPFSAVSWLGSSGFWGSPTLSSSCSMRTEN